MATRILVWNGTQFDTVDSDTVDGYHSIQLQGLGQQDCVTDTTRPAYRGLTMYESYRGSGAPETYGNVISLYGEGTRGGAGELFIGWSGNSTSTSGAHAGFYVRSLRDTDGSMWSDWARVYTTAYKPTPADIGALPTAGGYLTGNIGYTGSGYNGRALMFHAGDANGVGVSLSAGGLTLIGGGESANAYVNSFPDGGTAATENAVICADSAIIFRTGVQGGFDDSKKVMITNTGQLRANGEITSSSANTFRAVYGNYGYFVRNDGSNIYHMLTNSGDQYGGYNSLRPLSIACTTGNVTMGHSLTVGNSSGNVKRTTISTANPSGGANGDVWIKYS